jgi:importin-9
MEVLIEIFRNKQLRSRVGRLPPDYFLALFHQCLAQQSLVTSFVGLLEGVCEDYGTYSGLVAIFASFTGECLKAYNGILRSEQKKLLKSADTELILTALRVAATFIAQSALHEGTPERERLAELSTVAVEILDINEDVQVQVALSLFLKGVLRIASDLIASRKDLVDQFVNAVRILLRVPKDKSFESASVYAGNLTALVFEKLLKRNHNEILQEIVLKVFRSRTPSVIQSLVLVYSRLINQGTTQCKALFI